MYIYLVYYKIADDNKPTEYLFFFFEKFYSFFFVYICICQIVSTRVRYDNRLSHNLLVKMIAESEKKNFVVVVADVYAL